MLEGRILNAKQQMIFNASRFSQTNVFQFHYINQVGGKKKKHTYKWGLNYLA